MATLTNLPVLNEPQKGAFSNPAGILAIHGSASNGKVWRPLQAALHGQREVIAPDLDGYGSHHMNGSQQDRLDQLGALLFASPGPKDLVAHSFGGAVALKLANTFPSRVRSVTIYDPVVSFPNFDGSSRLPADLQAHWIKIDASNAADVMQFFMNYWSGEGAWQTLPAEKQARLLAHHATMLRDVEELKSGKWTVPASRYRGPVTMFRGMRSKPATQQSCHQIKATFPQARWINIPDADHLAPMTNPEPVFSAIVDCLSNIDADFDQSRLFQSQSAA